MIIPKLKFIHAVEMLVFIAVQNTYQPIHVQEIAAYAKVSTSYVEYTFRRLRNAGIIKSARGPGGGYRLAMMPENITLLMVSDALEPGEKTYLLLDQEWGVFMDDLRQRMRALLSGYTIATMMED